MKWSSRADKRIVEAVVSVFRDPAERSVERFAGLNHRDWARSYHWLDASGMALYLLDRLQALGIENAIPAATFERLQQNLADNRLRGSSMFDEFCSLNHAFLAAGVQYANLKGFTLSPESCPNPWLRCQLDFDFLIDGSQLELGREILAKAGYTLTAATDTTWEFKAGGSELVKIEDHYKPRPQRSVELHFAFSNSLSSISSPTRDARLDRLAVKSWDGLAFPVLASSDQFVGQALHLLGHLCGACTRLAWILEYKRHLAYRANDSAFLYEVQERAKMHRHAATAIGLTSLLSARIFGGESPAQLNAWTLDRISAPIQLWGETYGTRAVLADFPGTKLYLFLLQELEQDDSHWRERLRRRLLPLHGAPRLVQLSPSDSTWKKLRAAVYQLQFNIFRLRFHAVEGIRYLIENTRWKYKLRTLTQETSCQSCISGSTSTQLKDTSL